MHDYPTTGIKETCHVLFLLQNKVKREVRGMNQGVKNFQKGSRRRMIKEFKTYTGLHGSANTKFA